MDYTRFAPQLLIERDGPLRIVTMNRPEQLNAFDTPLHDAMRHVWDAFVDDDEAGAVVLTGAGRLFSSGGDIPNFMRAYEDYNARRRDIREAERLFRAMVASELPMVAAVNGHAVGLGCSVALLCDLVVMSEDAYLSDPHVSVGLVAGDGGVATWPLYIGMQRAKEYLLLGDKIPAADALRLGLANRVVPAAGVLSEAVALANRLAAQPRQAVRDTKRALNMHIERAANGILSFALAAESESFTTEDLRERTKQFIKA